MKKIIIITLSIFFVYACTNSSKKSETINNKKITNSKLNTSNLSEKKNNEELLGKGEIDTIVKVNNVEDKKKIKKSKPLKSQAVSKTTNNKKKEEIVKNIQDKIINDKKNQFESDVKVVENNKTNNLDKNETKTTTTKKIIKQKNTVPIVDERMRSFVKKKNKINGEWSFKQEGNKTYIVFYGNFKTKKEPDLEIFLNKKNIDNVTSKNALNESIFIQNLKSNRGEQKYLIPPSIDLSQYKSIIIHCKKYAILWGGSTF